MSVKTMTEVEFLTKVSDAMDAPPGVETLFAMLEECDELGYDDPLIVARSNVLSSAVRLMGA